MLNNPVARPILAPKTTFRSFSQKWKFSKKKFIFPFIHNERICNPTTIHFQQPFMRGAPWVTHPPIPMTKLHWILFQKANPKISEIQAIKLWNRFIDDIIGIWRGSRRSFDNFVKTLNQETMKYGIKFPLNAVQFGKSVNMLDVTAY